jgi:hypothetical protein
MGRCPECVHHQVEDLELAEACKRAARQSLRVLDLEALADNACRVYGGGLEVVRAESLLAQARRVAVHLNAAVRRARFRALEVRMNRTRRVKPPTWEPMPAIQEPLRLFHAPHAGDAPELPAEDLDELPDAGDAPELLAEDLDELPDAGDAPELLAEDLDELEEEPGRFCEGCHRTRPGVAWRAERGAAFCDSCAAVGREVAA